MPGTIFGGLGGLGKGIMSGKNLFTYAQNNNMGKMGNKIGWNTNPHQMNNNKYTFGSTFGPKPLPLPSHKFKAIMNSPKKSKSKKKRLYINKKKVPKWA
jgi:hypothetical protein